MLAWQQVWYILRKSVKFRCERNWVLMICFAGLICLKVIDLGSQGMVVGGGLFFMVATRFVGDSGC